MCIQKKIAELQAQIDAKLKFKALLEKTQPLLTSISVICSDYRKVAPEELPFLMDEILQAAQVDLSVAAISVIASTDEKAQDFAVDAITQAIEQRASVAFKEKSASEIECEPDESTDSISNIPDVNLADVYNPIDSFPASTIAKEDLETPGQLSLQFDKEYDAAVEEELALDADDMEDKSRTITINSKDKKWTVEITNNSKVTGYVSFLFQTTNRNEGFTHRVTTEGLLENPGTWSNHVERILREKSSITVPEVELTALQKLLLGNSNFTFEDLGVSVAVQSIMTEQEIEIDGSEDEDDDNPAPEEVEEALFTCCNAKGTTKEYYHDAKQLVRGCQHLTTAVIFNAEHYAKKFLQDLKKDAEIKGKIERWNADETLQSNQQSSQSKEQEPADLIEKFSIINLPLPYQEMTVRVTPAIGDGKLTGATFTFYRGTEELFSSSETIEEIVRGEYNPELIAVSLAQGYLRQEEKLALDDLIEKFLITHLSLPCQNMKAVITPAIGNGKFAGATFTFYSLVGNKELFETAQTADEIARGENNPKLIAVALAENWVKCQELKNSSPVGTTHTEKPKDNFTELVYLSDAVAYLKREDTGEILRGYLGFSNKTPSGDRAPTMAKSRAAKWQEHLAGVYQLTCSGPRECQRIESKNPKMPFKYELTLVKPSMGQLQGLASENFGLYPNEVEEKREGSEARSELLVPPTEKTETKLSDFEFERIADFDELNPEFSVSYKGEYLTRIWSSLRTTTAGQQPHRLWRHGLLKPGEEIELKDTEAAVFHALQRTRGWA
jgi:hypothetical protein